MKRSRIGSALLILAATTALAACGETDTATTAGSSSPAPTSAAPSPPAASSAAATPTSSAATGGVSDKKLCESAQKAGDEMKAALVAIATAGEPSAADFKKILTGLEQKVTAVASTGGDSRVATALREFAGQASKAAAAADPAAAADNPAFEKAGADITAACKAAGVSVNF